MSMGGGDERIPLGLCGGSELERIWRVRTEFSHEKILWEPGGN